MVQAYVVVGEGIVQHVVVARQLVQLDELVLVHLGLEDQLDDVDGLEHLRTAVL